MNSLLWMSRFWHCCWYTLPFPLFFFLREREREQERESKGESLKRTCILKNAQTMSWQEWWRRRNWIQSSVSCFLPLFPFSVTFFPSNTSPSLSLSLYLLLSFYCPIIIEEGRWEEREREKVSPWERIQMQIWMKICVRFFEKDREIEKERER